MQFRSLLLLVAAAPAALLAQAQTFDFYACNIAVLQDKGIQGEIGVTEAQRKSLNTHASWYNGETEKLQKQGAAAKTDAERQAIAKKFQALIGPMKDRCLKVLTPGQIKRLRELSLQLEAPAVLLDERVAKQVGVSADQLKKMRTTYEANVGKAKKLQESTFRPIMQKYDGLAKKAEKLEKSKKEAELKRLQAALDKEMKAAGSKIQPQVVKLGTETRNGILKALSPAQRSAYDKLLGKAYKFQ